MCFRSMQGDLQDNPTAQAIRVISTDSTSSPAGTRKADSQHFLGTSRDLQSSDPSEVIQGIGPGVEGSTAPAPAPKEAQKSKKWDKPSWRDIFRVDGPPLQSYERDVNGRQDQREGAKDKMLRERLENEGFQRGMKKKGGLDWGGQGVW
ncbi:hypothetical protein MMC18_009267 [Xylographa bjoerkii]|nr:hypothetical protein [Xylographa bjoerkii]